jgi:hypothetical protein
MVHLDGDSNCRRSKIFGVRRSFEHGVKPYLSDSAADASLSPLMASHGVNTPSQQYGPVPTIAVSATHGFDRNWPAVSCTECEGTMEQQFPVALQVALYCASGALIVLAAVLVRVMLRFEKQCDRILISVERVEAELTPLAREARVAVDRLSDLSGSAQRAVEVAGRLLLPPVRAFNRATKVLRTGATVFLQALLTRRPQPWPDAPLDNGTLPS